jgi:hypothetical protein
MGSTPGRGLSGSMRRLHAIGFDPDSCALILSARKGAKQGSFLIAVDDALMEQIDSVRAVEEVVPPAPPRSSVDSALTPREIQVRLRAGRTVDEVAREAGVSTEWVERFAAPVLAEQAAAVTRAGRAVLHTPRKGPSDRALEPSVLRNLADRGVMMLEEDWNQAWSARHLVDADWMISFSFRNRGRAMVAEWMLNMANGALTPRNRLGTELGYVDPGRRSAVSPLAPSDVEAIPPAPARRTRRATGGRAAAKPAAGARKTRAKKATAKKAAAKRSPVGAKATGKRAVGAKATPRKAAARKKAVAKKAPPSATAAVKKRAVKATAAKKAAAKRTAAKAVATKRMTAKAVTTKRTATKKVMAKRVTAAEKAPVRNIPPRGTTPKKAATRKALTNAAVKQPAVKRAPATKRAPRRTAAPTEAPATLESLDAAPAPKAAAKRATARKGTAGKATTRKATTRKAPARETAARETAAAARERAKEQPTIATNGTTTRPSPRFASASPAADLLRAAEAELATWPPPREPLRARNRLPARSETLPPARPTPAPPAARPDPAEAHPDPARGERPVADPSAHAAAAVRRADAPVTEPAPPGGRPHIDASAASRTVPISSANHPTGNGTALRRADRPLRANRLDRSLIRSNPPERHFGASPGGPQGGSPLGSEA